MKTKLLILLSFMFFVACGDGKTTPPSGDDDAVPDMGQDETQDESQDDTLDTVDENDLDSNESVDEDIAPTITLTCPDTVDETEEKATCTITLRSPDDEPVITASDTCSGNISAKTNTTYTYSFDLNEARGPSTCIVSAKSNTTGEVAEATITVNEVNEPPTIDAPDTVAFAEDRPNSEIDIQVKDVDRPNGAETDPGFATLSLTENSCGNWVTLAREGIDTPYKLIGTMPESQTSGNCSLTIQAKDGYGATTEKDISVTLVEKNEKPVWKTEPENVTIVAGESYNEINGVGTDVDLPNAVDGDPGFVTCVYDSDNCSFDVSVTTERVGAEASCRVGFTAGDVPENCYVEYHLTDGTNVTPVGSAWITVSPSVTIECPDSVNEGDEIVCDITAIGGEPTVQGWSENSCHGTISKEGDEWKYRYTTTEADGPKTCDAAVKIDNVKASDSVEIKEINQSPTITLIDGCSENATAQEDNQFRCNIRIDDPDLPSADSTDPGYTSCEIKNNSCGDWLTFNTRCSAEGTPGETVGGTECSYTVEVTDGYGETVSKTIHITVEERNLAPYTNDTIPQLHLMTGEHYVFTFTAKDDDLPNSNTTDPGYVVCKNVAAHDGHDDTNSTISITGEGAGSALCTVTVDAGTTVPVDNPIFESFAIILEDGTGLTNPNGPYSYLGLPVWLQKCVFYTTPDATGIGGRTWEDALPISEVATHAWSGCEVWAKQGTYTPPSDDGAAVLTMKDGVTILGGFAGNEDPYADYEPRRVRPEPLVPSILDGEHTSNHVVIGASSGAQLDGFIIENGHTDERGGGLYLTGANGNLLLKNIVFQDNYANLSGGAIYFSGTSGTTLLQCENTVFNNNSRNAVTINGSSATFTKSQFSNNSGSDGGAIYIRGDATKDLLTVVNTLFYNNSAPNFGGAIDVNDIPMQISFSTFVHNQDYYGYVFSYYDTSNKDISHCIFWDNDAGDTSIINYSYVEGISQGTGNISSMPAGSEMFIDEAHNDFHLDPTSPVIDAGDTNATVTDDLDGAVRPQGDAPDMGAYEFASVKADKFVDCDASTSGDGNSWTTAYNTVQEAVDALPDGGAIFITGYCTYSESGQTGDHLVQLHNGIKLYGGFSGDAQFVRERPHPITNRPTLDGEHQNITVIKSDATDIVVDGLVIKNARKSGLTSSGGNGRVTNTSFIDNLGEYGGAINLNSSYGTWNIVNTVFERNTASQYGGAISAWSSTLHLNIINATVVQNMVTAANNSHARAIIFSPSNPNVHIVNSVFYQNVANWSGSIEEISGGTATNTTYSFIEEISSDTNLSGDPGFENVPTVFALVVQSHTDYIYVGAHTGTITTDMLLQFDDDTTLYTIDSIGAGGDIHFSPALTTAVPLKTPVSFWPAGTTDTTLDVHLRSDSQCRDKGTYREESTYDAVNKRRFSNDDTEILFDMGAYEY